MTIRDTGGPAFPTPFIEEGEAGYQTVCTLHGMSLRDYIACAALQGILAAESDNYHFSSHQARAENSYQIADAMLKAREQP